MKWEKSCKFWTDASGRKIPFRSPGSKVHCAPRGRDRISRPLRNVPGIDPTGMRILRHFTLVLMVDGKGYYRDARGTKLELGPGDVILVFPEIAHAYGPLPGHEWTQIYFVFDGPQFQLWRAQGLLAPEHPCCGSTRWTTGGGACMRW